MNKKEKATREYLETLSKEQVINLCLQFMFDIEVTEQQLAEKDKEIEEKMMSFEKRCQEYYKSDEFKRDFAIQELEKVKDYAWFNYEKFRNYLNQQIKKLSNNTFKCEICGEITPKECEGGEPNVCADCVPT